MLTDIEIAQAAKMRKILELAQERLGVPSDALDPYGHYKAKMSLEYIEQLKDRPDGKLILVTAMSPTPAGEGKTTTTVGLADALNRIGVKTVACLREPSLGPVFGVKGGAAGGGHAQVVPMEDINLHFTGDLHAVGTAHNLLSALLDNHIHQGNELNIDPRLVNWKRVMDMNDRALRKIIIGQGGVANGFMRDDGFDITVASEVMAILCLSTSLADLRERLGRIVVAQTSGPPAERKSITAADLKAHGSMAALLKEAFKPNVVQTLENNIAMIHGGPFANIAHGCNSFMATFAGMKLGDYCVTEAGFGADLGAEKFVDIKCRLTGLRPAAAVIVASIKALKHHGGSTADGYKVENVEALKKGLANLDRHLSNIKEHYGLPVVVSVNHFYHDTDAEVAAVMDHLQNVRGVPAVLAKHWAFGGAGAEELAKAVVAAVEANTSPMKFVYPTEDPLWAKIRAVATKIYGARDIDASEGVRKRLDTLSKKYPNFPVCIAKTQSSFSTDASKRGAPSDHAVEIREVRLAAGAGFVVAICGDIMTMPGLPKVPAAEGIDIDATGRIIGLF